MDIPIDNVFLLNENHKDTETFNFGSDISITLCDNIEKCVFNSDITILIRDEKMPTQSLIKTEHMANKMNKKYVIIENPWSKPSQQNGFDENCIRYSGKPVILLISYGRYTQQYCTEILLNKVFSGKNIRFIQEYAYETEMFFSQLSEYGILNKNLILNRESSDKEYDVFIKSIKGDSLESISGRQNFAHTICEIVPDYIILNTNFRFSAIEYMKTYS